MKVTKFGVLIIIFIVFLSIFIAKVSNIIAVSSDTNSRKIENHSVLTDSVVMKDSSDNLIWFIQISDLHISIFHDKSRITEFQEFCDVTIDAIRPAVVIASGDLTDAKHENNIGSRQYEDEWIHYKSILEKCQISKKTIWLDVRGNHDNFNVPGPIAKENYFRNYSVQGRKHPKSYVHKIYDKNGNLYSFIALDACLEPGPRRPFNFMGILTHNEMKNVNKLAESSISSTSTIWFGHFPTSCILSPISGGGVRSLIGERGIAYLCGHLHTLGGLLPNMYTLQQSGYLELELGDWKDNRMFRVAAVDHGLFSFVDVKHREWPIVLVTNPKHALFVVSSKEPIHRMLTSTHIRILVFSLGEISSVKIRLPKQEWVECLHSGGPLYNYPWKPSLYSSGLNFLEVKVVDLDGREKTISHPFSLDGTRPKFGFFARVVLMSNMNAMFHILFGLAVIGCVLPLCVVRCLSHAVKVKTIIRPRFNQVFLLKTIIHKLSIVSNIDVFFYSLIFYPLYMSIGPWTIGEIIEGYVGVIFVWGTFVNGSYLPGSFTYAYGFAQLVLFQFPLILYLSHHLDRRVKRRLHLRNKALSCVLYIWQTFPFFLIISIQLAFTYSFWLEYGGMAVFFGPLRLWSIVYALFLCYYAHVIPESAIRTASAVLNSNSPVTVTVTPCEEDTGNLNEFKITSSNDENNNSFGEEEGDTLADLKSRNTCSSNSIIPDFIFCP